MKVGVFLRCLLLLALSALHAHCFAQSKLRIQHLGVEEGLSQSSVYSITQDRFGFIWMATGDGLNRYDGKEFISYKSKLTNMDLGHLKDRNINSVVYEDCFHNLWFTADEGVYCMDRRTGKPEVYINKYVVGYSGQVVGVDSDVVWVPITGRGVYAIDARTKAIHSYKFTDTFHAAGAIYPVLHGISSGRYLWIVDVKGLIRFDKIAHTDTRVIVREGMRRVCKIGPYALALSVDDGVLVFDTRTGEQQFVRLGVEGKISTHFTALAADLVSGHLYVADNDGGTICKVDLNTRKYESLHFQDNQVVRMYIDRAQNLWVGTDGGGAYKVDIKPPKFNCYIPLAGGTSGAMIKSLYQGSNGVIWAGLYGRGIMRYDPVTGKEELLPLAANPEATYFNGLFKDSSGDIVVALNDRIAWLDEQTGRVKQECSLPLESFMGASLPVAFAITEWRKGVYLVGSNQCIYYVHRAAGMVSVEPIHRFNDVEYCGWVYGFYRHNSCLYIGKRNGFSKVTLVNDSIPRLMCGGLRDMPIRHFYKSASTPFLWLASEQGLLAYNEQTGKYTVFDEDDGIANSFIYVVLPQGDSVLWLSTNKGISRVAVRYILPDSVSLTVKNYSVKDGLQSSEFNSGAYFSSADGTLFFGGIAGINWFHPDRMAPNHYLAHPVLTGIYVEDTLIARDTAMYTRQLVLPYTRNTISLTFRALEYTLPEQNRYAYKLDGLDQQWVYTANDRVRFAKLAPGTYKFMLRVSNNEGLWNEEPLVLDIIITPPFWRTWWFGLLVVLVGITVIVLVARYYTRRKLLAHTRDLEKQYALNMERLRISKDVHDDIGSGLSRISLLSELASKRLGGDQVAAKDMSSISSLSKELVDNMRDLIWVLNPENTTLDSLVARIREYCADYLDGVGVEADFKFPSSVPSLSISREVQRNIFSTVKEAVSNSVKHSNATRISVEVHISGRSLSISISDNGVGFEIGKGRSGGNGLRNMRFRVENVGGEFNVETAPGAGTSVSLTISLDRLAQD